MEFCHHKAPHSHAPKIPSSKKQIPSNIQFLNINWLEHPDFIGRVRGSSPLLPTIGLASKCSQRFVNDLLDKFIASRPEGCSKRTLEFYLYTLRGFVGYPLNSEGVRNYLNSLICGNGKVQRTISHI